MTPADRRRTPGPAARSLVAGLVVALVVGACGNRIQPIVTVAPSATRAPTPAATTTVDAFARTAYPPGGPAPCDQAAPPDAAHSAYGGELKRIRATDASTVVFELCRPDVAFLAKIAAPAFSIEDSGWLRTHPTAPAGSQPAATGMNGTGPYRLERWDPGAEISLARNDAYWGAVAKNERVIVRWLADPGAQVAKLQDGTVDGLAVVGPGQIQTVTDDAGLTLKARAGLNVVELGFNTRTSPFDSEKVRQAIAMGLDRRHLVEAFFPAGSQLATHAAPCAIPHGCSGPAWYDFDPTLARETLKAAGFPDGFEMTLHYAAAPRPDLPDPTGLATELKTELLDNLGITATLAVEPDATFAAGVDAGSMAGVSLLDRTASFPDLTALLDPEFGPGGSAAFGGPFADIAKALASGRSTADPAKRDAAYALAAAAIRARVPVIPLANSASSAAFRADVAGAAASPFDLERLASMSPGDRRQLVWLMGAEPPGLSCADETDPAAQVVCAQVMDTLYAYEPGGAASLPSLARRCDPSPDLTVWTCTLRSGITFHDGSALDAGDVLLSFAVEWDADHPLRRANGGSYATFRSSFGGFLDPPAVPGG